MNKKFTISFDETKIKCETWPFYDPVKSGSTVTESDSLVFTALIEEDVDRVDYWTVSNMEKYNSARKSIDIEVGVENAIQMSDGTYKITADYSTHKTLKATLSYNQSEIVAYKGKTIYDPGTELLEGAEVNFRPIFAEDQVVENIKVNDDITTNYHPSYNDLTLYVGKDTVKDGKIDVKATFRAATKATASFTKDENLHKVKKLDYYKCYVTEEETSRKEISEDIDKVVSEYDHIYFYNNEGKLATDKEWYLEYDDGSKYEIRKGSAGLMLTKEILSKGNFEIKYV